MVASRFKAISSVRLATPGTVSWMLMSLTSSQGGVLGKKGEGFSVGDVDGELLSKLLC